jgi:peptidyl-prolyl cis-trans isomerase SurA
MRKKLCVVCAVSVCAGVCAGEETAGVAVPSTVTHGSAVVALVNGKPITFEEVWSRVGRELEYARTLQSEEGFRTYARELLAKARKDLIERTVLLARAQEEEIKVHDRDVERYAERDMEYLNQDGENLTTLEDYWHAIEEKTGFSEKKWREELRARVTVGQLYRKYVWQPDFFSPDVVRSYYEEHTRDFQEGGYVTVRHVYVMRELPQYRQAVAEIEQALARGEDFKEIAARAVKQGVSNRRGSRDGAGKYIYRLDKDDASGREGRDCDGSLESLREPIPQVVRKLRPGEVSKAVHTPLGTHFLQVIERGGGRVKSFPEVQVEIQKKLTRQLENRAEDQYIKDLVAKADVKTMPFPTETPIGKVGG